jgi:hypothetical protein
MPKSLPPLRGPVRHSPFGNAPPAVRLTARCPACGRGPAVVFPDVRAGGAAAAARRVCLDCCPAGAPDPARPGPAAGGS